MINIFESDLRPMQFWTALAEREIERLMDGGSTGYLTGLKDLDRYIRFRRSEYTIIGGQSSMGKTSLGMQTVEAIANQIEGDGVVAVFSAEMAGQSLALRMGAALSGVNLHKAQSGKASRTELMEIKNAVNHINTMPIWIDDNSAPTTTDMLAQLSRLIETIPVKAMMFDFLELGGDDERTEEQRIGKISQRLKGIAKTLDIPVIALSQLNDDANNRANKMPALSDLRYSRKSGHLADNVLLIMRPGYYFEKGQHIDGFDPDADKNTAIIVVAKQRNGPTGLVKCAYLPEKMRFVDVVKTPLSNSAY